MIPAGGEGRPGPGRTPRSVPGAGHIPCVICTDTIGQAEYRTARVWTDPAGITCAAHHSCLVRVGEADLDLPPAA